MSAQNGKEHNTVDYTNWSKKQLLDKIYQLEGRKPVIKSDIPNLESTTNNNSNTILSKPKKQKVFDFSKYTKRKIALKFAYLGWNYQGLALQAEETGLPTVEEKIMEALFKVKLIGTIEQSDCDFSRCGRTDKGVSAMNQVISLVVRSKLSEEELQNPSNDVKEIDYIKIINNSLPDDIRVHSICLRPPNDFDARFSCTFRHYKYIFNGEHLDIKAMQEAAQYFLGDNDFRNFCKIDASKQIKNFRRTILMSQIDKIPGEEEFYVFNLKGTAFLWHQVRCMIAVLLTVAQKHEDPIIVKELLDVNIYPAKPTFKMAHDVPLVLYDCGFNENMVQWTSGPERSFHVNKVVDGLWNDYKIKSVVTDFMKHFTKDDTIEKSGKIYVNLGDGIGQSMNSVQVASTYVVKSVSTLMVHVPEKQKKKIDRKRIQLENKIETVTYSIEIIKLMAARGNSNLSYVLKLTDFLKEDIDEFVKDIAVLTSGLDNKKLSLELLKILEKTIDDLVEKIDNIIPILNLVLTTYGTATINNFQDYVSPGRLLNSTVLVSKSNEEFLELKSEKEISVGPDFFLTFYNIFYNQNSEQKIIWKEKYARCRFQIIRVPNKSSTYMYELRITEDFNDDRYHEEDELAESKVVDIRQISKLFFSASGRLLKLEDRSTPVLVLKTKKTTTEKLDKDSIEGVEKHENNDDSFEWFAIGDYERNSLDDESDDEDDEYENDKQEIESKANDKANLNTFSSDGSPLSLLEYLIRLCTLQANDQISVLDVKDERLRLYLSDENYMNNTSSQIASLNKKMENLKL
ncbi:hypothetical protein C6P42_004310 [Pichia californica]|nr:hypothetical protein C6P42_004310 [[Candida] californica]